MPGAEPSSTPPDEQFRASMRARREQLGISQGELARRIREHGPAFHQQTVARIESGERPVRLSEAYLIGLELGVPVEQLIAPGALRMQLAADEIATLESEVELGARRYLDAQVEYAALADETGAAIDDSRVRALLVQAPEDLVARARATRSIDDALALRALDHPTTTGGATAFVDLLREEWSEHGEHPEAPER